LETANQQVDRFEDQYRHLVGWQTLVNSGSQLYDSLQQMDQMTRAQADEFEKLSRDIRGDISSKANKLDALPNYSIYAHRLATIEGQVRKLREEAQQIFTELQGRYRNALTADTLYRAQQLDRPVEYNFSNPADAYHRLESEVQKRLEALAQKMMQVMVEQRQKIINTLSTPLIKTLTHEDRDRVRESGNNLSVKATETIDAIRAVENRTRDISVIRDFPATDGGQFSQLIQHFVQIRDQIAASASETEKLSHWLSEFALTPEEDHVFAQLQVEDIEDLEDLIEWRNRCQQNDDEFWNTIRGLYAKQRIRIRVSRVRR